MNLNERSKIVRIIRCVLDFFGIDPGRRLKIFQIVNLNLRVLSKIGRYYLRLDEEFCFCSRFSRYLYNEKILREKTDILKENLDAKSQKLIDELIKRYKYLFTNNIIGKDLFSNSEKQERKNIKWNRIKKKYPNFVNGCVSTFKYHNGLKLVPEEALENIKNKAVIDAGGYDGDSAIMFNLNYNFRNIFSFEPMNKNFEKLKKNIKKFKATNIFAINKGIGDRSMKCGIIDNGAGSFMVDDNKSEEVEITTIDEFVSEKNIEIGLIKMDIEGFESRAIRGAIKTIKKDKPVLLISIYHSGEDFFDIKPFIENLCSGYVFKIAKLDPHPLISEVVLIGWDDRK